MKPTPFLIAVTSFLTFAGFGNARAQTTYTIASNKNWTTVVGSTSCWTCTFNITPGVTFTLDYAGTCGSCTFNNGNLNVTQNIACQGCSFNTNAITAAGTQLNLQSSTNNFSNSTVSVTGAGSLFVSAGISATGSTFTFNNNSYFNFNGGSFTASSSLFYFYGSSYFLATSGPISLKNTSNMVAGDGTMASNAYLNFNGPALQIHDNSLIKISNQNNYYANWGSYTYYPSSGSSTSYSTLSNNFNCNQGAVTGYANSCSMNYVYGCATLNSAGLAACSTLAVADISLSATAAGPGQVSIVFADQETSAADHYLVQRNAGDGQWNTISTVNAGSYTGEYRFTDADAPAGTIKYRIERIDPGGKILYSSVASVSVTAETNLSIHPNPATGGTFYITTSKTGEMIINVFTITGQLIYRTEGKGQTQYSVHLPAQAQALGTVLVQTISEAGNRTFTLLVR